MNYLPFTRFELWNGDVLPLSQERGSGSFPLLKGGTPSPLRVFIMGQVVRGGSVLLGLFGRVWSWGGLPGLSVLLFLVEGILWVLGWFPFLFGGFFLGSVFFLFFRAFPFSV